MLIVHVVMIRLCGVAHGLCNRFNAAEHQGSLNPDICDCCKPRHRRSHTHQGEILAVQTVDNLLDTNILGSSLGKHNGPLLFENMIYMFRFIYNMYIL